MRGLVKKLTILIAIVTVITCFSSGVFAAYNYYTCKKTESVTYLETASGDKSDSVGYDYGTSLPFDDASATARASGKGSNYVYLNLSYGTSKTFYKSYTNTNNLSASYQFVAWDYDSMTGTVKAKNSSLNGVQLSITN